MKALLVTHKRAIEASIDQAFLETADIPSPNAADSKTSARTQGKPLACHPGTAWPTNIAATSGGRVPLPRQRRTGNLQ
jgi:hypothetical protein